jgi:hypothetical protein
MAPENIDDRETFEGMGVIDFELHVTVPLDVRLAGAVRALAVCAAQQVGCAEAEAAAFGRYVEEAVRASLQGTAGDRLPVTVRHRASIVEVVVNGHTLTLDF